MKNRFALAFFMIIIAITAITLILSFILGAFSIPRTPIPEMDEAASAKCEITVIIDAGHGGEDGGASSINGLVEKDVNLHIASLLCDMLEANGVNVIMTRTDDRLLYDRNTDYQGRKKISKI